MKPHLELLQPALNESFMVRHYSGGEQNDARYPWHYHEEIEIVYIKGGSGTKYVGNHMSLYNDGELVLIGPNVPHCGLVDKDTNNESQTIIYIKKHILLDLLANLPEGQSIRSLLHLLDKGLSLIGTEKDIVGKKIEDLVALKGFERVLKLLDIFYTLSISTQLMVLNHDQPQSLNPNNHFNEQRISIIFNYIQANFNDKMNIADVAAVIDMTESAFCRYFKKYTGKTFTHYLNHFRIMHACQLLRNSDENILQVGYSSGFSNFSYFNRTFKKVVGMSPSSYKKTII
jgi:AraC-like DNA-binding protein